MVICGSYTIEFDVCKDMKKKDIIREVAIGKVATHFYLTLIINKLETIVEQCRVVTTLNTIKH